MADTTIEIITKQIGHPSTTDAPIVTIGLADLGGGVYAVKTSGTLPTGAAQDGTDVTTPSPAMPAGGVGVRGWLSAIWTKLNASLAVTLPKLATGTYASAVSVLSTATAIIAANANRIGIEVHHQGTATARVWLGADNTLTAGATGKNFGYLDPGDSWERRDYTGAVYGRTEAGTAYVSSLEV